MLILQLLLLPFAVLKLTYSQVLKPTYGGGCAIVDDQLYYLGGAQKLPGNVFSRFVYALDLAKGFQTTNSWDVPWTLKNTDQLAPSFLFPNVLSYKNRIFVHGGQYTQHEQSMMEYDTTTNTWSTNTAASSNELVGPYYTNTTENVLVDYYSSWTKADSSSYVLLGGIVPTISRQFFANKLVSYFNPTDNVWSADKVEVEKSIFNVREHSSFLYQKSIYSLGGQFFPSNDFVPMDNMYKYNLQQKSWSQVQLFGDVPSSRVGLNTVLIDEYRVLLLGGATATSPTNFTQVNDTFILDMKSLKYTKLNLSFVPSYQGCAQKYNDHVIYVLGYSNQPNNLTQIIDINSLKVVDQLSATSTALSIGAIVGIALACLAALALILGFIYWFIRRKNREKLLRPPSPMLEPSWVHTNSNPNSTNTNPAMLQTQTNFHSDPLFSIQSLENTQLEAPSNPNDHVNNKINRNINPIRPHSSNNIDSNITFDDGGMLDPYNNLQPTTSKDTSTRSKTNLLRRLSSKFIPK